MTNDPHSGAILIHPSSGWMVNTEDEPTSIGGIPVEYLKAKENLMKIRVTSEFEVPEGTPRTNTRQGALRTEPYFPFCTDFPPTWGLVSRYPQIIREEKDHERT